jgi:hypothetical protein
MYAASMSRSAGAQVARSSQSNGGAPEREPIRVGTPRAISSSATRRPVLPVPPRTSVAGLSIVRPVMVTPVVDCVSSTIRACTGDFP